MGAPAVERLDHLERFDRGRRPWPRGGGGGGGGAAGPRRLLRVDGRHLRRVRLHLRRNIIARAASACACAARNRASAANARGGGGALRRGTTRASVAGPNSFMSWPVRSTSGRSELGLTFGGGQCALYSSAGAGTPFLCLWERPAGRSARRGDHLDESWGLDLAHRAQVALAQRLLPLLVRDLVRGRRRPLFLAASVTIPDAKHRPSRRRLSLWSTGWRSRTRGERLVLRRRRRPEAERAVAHLRAERTRQLMPLVVVHRRLLVRLPIAMGTPRSLFDCSRAGARRLRLRLRNLLRRRRGEGRQGTVRVYLRRLRLHLRRQRRGRPHATGTGGPAPGGAAAPPPDRVGRVRVVVGRGVQSSARGTTPAPGWSGCCARRSTPTAGWSRPPPSRGSTPALRRRPLRRQPRRRRGTRRHGRRGAERRCAAGWARSPRAPGGGWTACRPAGLRALLTQRRS